MISLIFEQASSTKSSQLTQVKSKTTFFNPNNPFAWVIPPFIESITARWLKLFPITGAGHNNSRSEYKKLFSQTQEIGSVLYVVPG